jgi:nucleoid-associated protein YgaU
MASTIGIKVANGEFYPIMEENSPVKKRLILTTAHDNQKSIQVDLYHSYEQTMADALYVGSLVVENLKPLPKGEPNIEMILSSNSAGQITANAVDLDSSVNGSPQHLSVSLADVAEDDRVNDEIPDFDLDIEPHEPPPRGLYDRDSSPGRLALKKKSPWPLLLIAVALLLSLGGLLYFFFFNSRGITLRNGLRRPAPAAVPATPALPQRQAPPAATQVQTAPAPEQPAVAAPQSSSQALSAPPQAPPAATQVQAEPAPEQPRAAATAAPQALPAAPQTAPVAPPVISADQQPPRAATGEAPDRTRTLPPVASYKVPQTIPRGGTPYTIRWGDTLWDISEAFYRNPWLYPRIARFNAIRNPDFIMAGSAIRIPPRN